MNHKLRDDEGFGLTEVMISMLLLLIIMMAMISAVISALQITANNGTNSTAAEAVQQRIEDVRAASVAGDCDVLEGAALPTTTVSDGRGVLITVSGSLASPCVRASASGERDPVQVMRLTVTANSSAPEASNPVVTTTTDILVKFQP
ncbi:hypothetical protein [Demequina zhanjiangensis]|uniref:Prepilin-type N-terminal cleavage/methylation domain-containing protein n=1 Tax=Demequina zhanjiangensis TaxID=3051659 RepID=A0ABT8G2I3_9MICO|nr:hypothetical protein [Demequina sp. SYSU T00b26]MDN4473354.1 hypothetical protein [Demequina sp. SYSU T00b26]